MGVRIPEPARLVLVVVVVVVVVVVAAAAASTFFPIEAAYSSCGYVLV